MDDRYLKLTGSIRQVKLVLLRTADTSIKTLNYRKDHGYVLNAGPSMTEI